MASDLLTPGDVKTKEFPTHRLREGYDMDAVDDFLDQCHDTILRMDVTIQALQNEARS
jgi:DivIVA domain-containing protein